MRRISIVVTLLFSTVGLISFLSIETAMGVVWDSRLTGLILSVLALIVGVILILRFKLKWPFAFLLLSSYVLAASIYELFFIYNEQSITFQNDGITFHGLYYEPKGVKDFPLVIMLHGAGEGVKEEYAFYSRFLARNGIASLAYDKRGSGETGGDIWSVGYDGYAKDASAAIDLLKSRHKYLGVGIWGISEGEWVGPILTTIRDDIDFMVLVSPCGVSPVNQVAREVTYRLEGKGHNAETILLADSIYRMQLNFSNDAEERKVLESQIQRYKNEKWFIDAEEIADEIYFYEWWYKVKDYNPVPDFQNFGRPILAIAGDKNFSYPSNEIEENFKRLGARTVILKDGDHSILTWPLGNRVPPPVFCDSYPQLVVDWIKSLK